MAGMICPTCGSVDNYKNHQGGSGKDTNSWTRRKKCKACGAVFETLEMMIGLITPGTVQAAAPAVPPVAEEVQPVIPLGTEQSTTQTGSIFSQ